MSSVFEMFYAARLAKQGRGHVTFMQYLADLPDLSSPRLEYQVAMKAIREHKLTCDRC